MNPDNNQVVLPSALSQNLRAVFGKLKRRVREPGPLGDLSASQISVLLRLEKDGPATAATLARAEGMRHQSMRPILAALEVVGLVRGASDPSDGRQILFSLTDACRDFVREGRAARQDWLTRAIQAQLSLQEQEELMASVELLKRLVDY